MKKRTTTRTSRPYQKPGSEIHFINVDLDIYSRWNLQPLADALGRQVFVLHVGREKRTYYAHLELPAPPESADIGIRRFCALIRRLPASERSIWDKARLRDFNIGVQAAQRPVCWTTALSQATMRATSEVGARIVVTIYSPDVRVIDVGAQSPADRVSCVPC